MKKQTTKKTTPASKEKTEARTKKTVVTEGSTLKELSDRIGVNTKTLLEKLDARGLSSAVIDQVTRSLRRV
jgi:hypothetical protein